MKKWPLLILKKMTMETKNRCKNTKSSEIFEINRAFLHISEKINYETCPKTIPELVNFLVSELHLNRLNKEKLRVFECSSDYINGAIDFGGANIMVKINEALKEAAISTIAEEIAVRPKIKVVLIAGPSSSGKTTFCKKLTYAIQQQGLQPLSISLDDYYGDSANAPLDEEGKPDWESLYALNLPMLQEHIATLLEGGGIRLPHYDFTTSRSTITDQHLRLLPDNVLLVEGIHALNPLLLSAASLPLENFYRIYISALTTRPTEDGGQETTTDNRLIRRMVRDSKFRATTACQTISRWQAVRNGEEKWIIPYQSQADVNFNSGYQYEYCLLREHALPLLEAVRSDEPEYAEAQRLIRLLHQYHRMPVHYLPPYSLLREFLGGSAYVY